jgi:hypothetical protein
MKNITSNNEFMLKSILSVSGKPGLYKMISQGKNMTIVESLVDKKRFPTYARDRVISLGDVAVYTTGEEVPLYSVFNAIKNKENCQKIVADLTQMSNDDLRNYMAEVLPKFDRERVYPSDIKHILLWYNLLLDVGISTYDPVNNQNEENVKDGEEPSVADVNKINKVAPKSTAVPRQKVNTMQPAGKSAQRTRQK